MDEVVAFLRSKKKGSFSKIVIEGHTDSVGSEKYNLDLSQRRANSIRNYMIDKYGYKPAELEAIGYGPRRPIADNGNFQGRALNRRVEFKLEK
jgi:outer membrane protein OmpA-like peptidoglycan-associated protein